MWCRLNIKEVSRKILERYSRTLSKLAESEKNDLNTAEDSNGSRRGDNNSNQQEKLENKDCQIDRKGNVAIFVG